MKNTGLITVTLRSITYAMKAQKLLYENGISSEVVRLGGEYAERGCTHGLRLAGRDRFAAEELMRRRGIPYVAVKML